MREKFYWFMLGFVVSGLIVGSVSVYKFVSDSRRLGELTEANRRTAYELEGEIARSGSLVKEVSDDVDRIKSSLATGTYSIAERIRKIAETVKIMEDRLLFYDRSAGGGDGISNSGVE